MEASVKDRAEPAPHTCELLIIVDGKAIPCGKPADKAVGVLWYCDEHRAEVDKQGYVTLN